MRNFDFRIAIGALIALLLVPGGTAFAQVKTAARPQDNAATKSSVVANTATPANPAAAPAGTPATAKPVEKVDPVHELLDQAINVTSKRHLTANSHSPWQIFHYILAMRQETQLRLGDSKVNAIEWLSTTEPKFDNEPWLLLTPHGAKFHPYTKKYFFEGHPSQFLALMSHSNLPMDYPFHVQGKVVTLTDLVNNTMKEVNTKEEVTWVLWALQHFLKSDATWVNQANEAWSIERLVQIESAAPVVGAPCGGNHRLFALTKARDKYLQSGGVLRGVWFQADQKIKQHIEIARSLQNPDGSFSSEFYKGKMQTNDVNQRFNTTGHTMEFLAVSLPKERLNEQWVRNAIWMLSRELILNQNTQIDCGPLFHSLDALILYRDRVRPKVSTPPVEKPAEVAIDPPSVANSVPKDKTKPSPQAESPKPATDTKPMPKPPEVAQVPSDAKPLDVKSSDSNSKPVPNPELKTVTPKSEQPKPELKVEPSKPEVPKATEPTPTKSSDDMASASRKTSALPKIDPSKLANIGQVAPTVRTSEPPTDLLPSVRKDASSLGAPALLPDLVATPLGNCGSAMPPVKKVAQGKAKPEVAKDESNEREPLPVGGPELETEEPCDAEEAVGTSDDQPVSALETSNP